MIPENIKKILERGDYRIKDNALERFNAIDNKWNPVLPSKGKVRIKNPKGVMEEVDIAEIFGATFLPKAPVEEPPFEVGVDPYAVADEPQGEVKGVKLKRGRPKKDKAAPEPKKEKRAYRIITEQERGKLILWYSERKSANEIATMLGVKRQTIDKIVKKLKLKKPKKSK